MFTRTGSSSRIQVYVYKNEFVEQDSSICLQEWGRRAGFEYMFTRMGSSASWGGCVYMSKGYVRVCGVGYETTATTHTRT